jgi:hypothetical protein
VRVTSERKRRQDERLKRDYSRYVAPGMGSGFNSLLPDRVVQLIRENNLQGVLQYLRTMPKVGSGPAVQGRQIAKTVANVIWNMGLKTKIRIVDSLPNEDLAIYDPIKDEILVTVDGLSGSTILHEAVHAATVKILSHFVAGRFNRLTPSQLAAARQLQSIMERTKSDLGRMFPNHYANLLEFVSYALTKADFQNDLAGINLPAESRLHYANYARGDANKGETANISNISRAPRSAWTEFKLSIAKLITAGVKRVKEVLSDEEQALKAEEEQTKYVPLTEEEVPEEDEDEHRGELHALCAPPRRTYIYTYQQTYMYTYQRICIYVYTYVVPPARR